MNGSRLGKGLASGARAGLFLGLAAAWLIAAVLVAAGTQLQSEAIGQASESLAKSLLSPAE